MDLPEALAWLDGHIDLEKTKAIAGATHGLSLDKMRALCDVLGDPQHDYPVVHLTGTNGKGSTARITSAILTTAGLTTGTYSSPHLERINERIARDGEPIADADLATALTDLSALEHLVDARPSYFELLTAAGFRWFSEVAVDAAVVEVGLLGRWDATNVVDARVAVLTNVGRDHTDGTEGWRQRIAEEKTGIVKPGSTFVCGETTAELLPILEGTPAERLLLRDRDFRCESNQLAVGGRVLTIATPHATYDELFLPLHGPHQGENATLALVAAEAFFDRALDPELVAEAFAGVTMPGRFEVVHRQPLVVLDGAHNPAGGRAIAATLAEDFAAAGERRLVLGTLGGRDPRELLAELDVAHAAEVITCTPPSPRAISADDLAAVVTEMGGRARPVTDVAEAVRQAVDSASDDDLVLVTGSLYTAGEARAACRALGML